MYDSGPTVFNPSSIGHYLRFVRIHAAQKKSHGKDMQRATGNNRFTGLAWLQFRRELMMVFGHSSGNGNARQSEPGHRSYLGDFWQIADKLNVLH